MFLGFARRNLRFGILQRYVMGEVFRAFALALLTITAVFVLLTVMSKAASVGLGPMEILKLIPYMIPASLPFTVPVSLLFASTVVYGRLAGDNEVIAVKTAGLSAMILIWPTIILAFFLSLALNRLSATYIPQSTHAGRLVIYQNLEDYFYKTLKKSRYADLAQWVITVKDVQGRTMIGPIFKKRAEKHEPAAFLPRPGEPEEQGAYDMIVSSKTAIIKFQFEKDLVEVYFEDANIVKAGAERSEGNFKDTKIEIPIPNKGAFNQGKMVEEMTVDEMKETEANYLEKIAMERERQAVRASMFIGAGQPRLVEWDQVQAAFGRFDYWRSECKKFQTEIQFRQAMSWGSLFFVVLGAPVGILFARRDFLSAFISCFMPIILVYYPLMLFGMNLGKEGIIYPEFVWTGNVVLWLAAFLWALPPVRKH